MSALRELIAFFGVEVDDKPLDKAGEKIEGLAKLVERAGATIGLAFGLHEIGEFIESQIQAAVEIGHTSEMLGLGVEELQAYQYAAANAGLSAEEAGTSLRFLNKNLGEAASGNANAAQAFAKLGVQIRGSDGELRGTQEVLADVAEGIAKLPSPAEKTAKAMELFGRAGARMIPLLNKGGDGIEDLYKEFERLGGGISEDYIKVAEEAHHETLKLDVVWRGVKATIGAQLIPAFGWLVSEIGEAVGWFREFSHHSYIVQTALATLGAIVGGLVVVWGVLNFEILLVVAAIALIILVVDDVYTAFKGGKSVIGDFIDSLFGIGATQEIVEALSEAGRELWSGLGDVWDATKELVGALLSLDNQGEATKTGLSSVIESIQAMGTAARVTVAAVEAIERSLTDVVNAWSDFKKDHPTLGKLAGFVSGNAKNPFNDAAANTSDSVASTVANWIAGPATASAPAGSQFAGGTPTQTNHTTVNIDVGTTGSPADAAKAVAAGARQGVDDGLNASFAAAPGGG